MSKEKNGQTRNFTGKQDMSYVVILCCIKSTTLYYTATLRPWQEWTKPKEQQWYPAIYTKPFLGRLLLMQANQQQ